MLFVGRRERVFFPAFPAYLGLTSAALPRVFLLSAPPPPPTARARCTLLLNRVEKGLIKGFGPKVFERATTPSKTPNTNLSRVMATRTLLVFVCDAGTQGIGSAGHAAFVRLPSR